MIRYYVVDGDLANGHDFEHVFYRYGEAIAKYNSIGVGKHVTFKRLYAYDDRDGDKTIMTEAA